MERVLALLTLLAGLLMLAGCTAQETSSGEEQMRCNAQTLLDLRLLSNITSDQVFPQNIRCSSQDDFSQEEMRGTYKQGDTTRQIYFHKIRGGMAASGQDSYYETCLVIDNQVVYAKAFAGRGNVEYRARCEWQAKIARITG